MSEIQEADNADRFTEAIQVKNFLQVFIIPSSDFKLRFMFGVLHLSSMVSNKFYACA